VTEFVTPTGFVTPLVQGEPQSIRHYGGHRHGLTPSTDEQLEHTAKVDKKLVRILGGIPTGRAPQRTATIIPFPVNRRRLATEAA
jgi:hypothetical protein